MSFHCRIMDSLILMCIVLSALYVWQAHVSCLAVRVAEHTHFTFGSGHSRVQDRLVVVCGLGGC